MRNFVSKYFMFFAILLMLLQPVRVEAAQARVDDAHICLKATQQIEEKYNIKRHMLTTISSVETGRWNEKEQQALAWPWTINAQGKGQFFQTKAEAIQAVKELQAQGVRSIDVGCMQINLSYHGHAFKNLEEAFDPKKNVAYAASFLKKLYESNDKDWLKAAMAYHSTVPQKALHYKKKIVSAFEMVKLASKVEEDQLFKERIEAQKAALKQVRQRVRNTIKSIPQRKTVHKLDANAWREAKLAEYRKNKLFARN